MMPFAIAATGGRKRITVPALPTSICVGPKSGAGVTVRSPLASCSIPTPRFLSPAIIKAESRECRGRRSTEGESQSAAKIRARLVTDLEPGIVIVALTGSDPRKGACQRVPLSIMSLSLPEGSTGLYGNNLEGEQVKGVWR